VLHLFCFSVGHCGSHIPHLSDQLVFNFVCHGPIRSEVLFLSVLLRRGVPVFALRTQLCALAPAPQPDAGISTTQGTATCRYVSRGGANSNRRRRSSPRDEAGPTQGQLPAINTQRKHPVCSNGDTSVGPTEINLFYSSVRPPLALRQLDSSAEVATNSNLSIERQPNFT
jgi:hypothetical protein